GKGVRRPMVASPPAAHASSSPGQLSSDRHRLPRPLALLLAAVGIVGVAWALFLPPFQAPDENSHFAYVQTLDEEFELPGDDRRPNYSSTEQRLAMDRSNAEQAAAVLE